MHSSDDLYLGNAPSLINASVYDTEAQTAGITGLQNSPVGGRGIGPLGRIVVLDVLPVTLSPTALRAASAIAGAGNVVLVAASNANVTLATSNRGEPVWQLDCERSLTFTSSGNDLGITFTITGYDKYGAKLSATRVGGNAALVETLKPFWQILTIASTGAAAGTVSIGVGDTFGMPVVVTDVSYVAAAKWAQTLAADAGTFVAADATSPATAATGAVRGTYKPSSASNGTRRLVMGLLVRAIAAGPYATYVGALGVPQNLAGS